jgi:FkbM family methyltransferase
MRMTPTGVRSQVKDLLGRVSCKAPPFRGKTRLMKGLDRLLGGRGVAQEVVRAGVRWELDTSEIIQFGIFYHGLYGASVIATLGELIAASAASEPVLWDVGANLGAVSWPLLARAPRLRVEAFEPSPRALSHLGRHAALNPALAARLRWHPVGLSDADAVLPFFESGSEGNRGVGSLAPMHNTVADGAPVLVTTGDACVASGAAAPPDFVKLDVEGWEWPALMGLEGTLRARRPALVMEYEPYRQADRRHDLMDFIGFLRGCGYARFDEVMPAGGLRPLISEPSPPRSVELLARP